MTNLPTNKTEVAAHMLQEVVARIHGQWIQTQSQSNLGSIADQFSHALKNEAEFLTIHYRNPLIDEGRLTKIVLGDKGRERTIQCLRQVLGSAVPNNTLPEQADVFHDHLLEIYFGLIGRADSFSDAALRITGRDRHAPKRTFTFTFDGVNGPHVRCNPQTEPEVHIEVTKNLQYRLLGWGGDGIEQAEPKDCKLLHPLYGVVWESLLELVGTTRANERSVLPDILRHCREKLETRCFFASREALVSGEAARLIRDEETRRHAIVVFKRLFTNEPMIEDELFENTITHKQQLIMIEQVLAMVQAAAIYAPVSSDKFSLFAHKVDKNYPFASGLTVGGRTGSPTLQDFSSYLVQSIDDACKLSGGGEPHSNPIEEKFEWLKPPHAVDLRRDLMEKGLSKDAFACLLYFANGLLGKDHEGERLSFRIAVATHEGLRECFTPIFGEMGLAGKESEEKFFRIDIPDDLEDLVSESTEVRWNRVINKLDSIIAVVQGNYSFLQDNSIYLCLAYVKQGLEVRYLAQLNPRLRRASATVLFHSISRIDNVKALSKTVSPAIIALLDKDHTGYIAFGGELRAIGTKGKPNQWRKYSEEEWFKSKLTSVQRSEANCWRFWDELRQHPFYDHLCAVIELISEAPGKGATFVLGKWGDGIENGLNKICVAMTPVFEMVKDWDIEKIDKDTLYQAAIQDGAIVIALDGKKRLYCRRQLTSLDTLQGPFDPDTWSPNGDAVKLMELWDRPPKPNQPNQYYWSDWGKWFKWGTRHKTAAGLAYIGRGEHSVVCVSSDGDIHLFDGYRVFDLSREKHEVLTLQTFPAAKQTAQ